MRTVRGPTGDVLPPELLPAVAVGATLVTGAFLVGLAAAVVSQHGLGNGFAVIIAAGAIENLARAAAAPAMLYGGVVDLPPIVLDVILLLVLASVMRWRRRRAQGEPFVSVPTCGLVPLQIAPYVLAIPFMLASWFPALARGAEALHVGSDAHSFVKLGLTVVLAILLARLFCSPAAVARAWARAAPASATPESAKAIGRALSQANRWSLLLVAVLAVLQMIGPVIVAVLDLAAIGAVLLDLTAEVRARSRATSLVAARPLHRVYAVEPALRALSEAGVSAFARTRYFRALYHFFAPYAPIEILVPAEQAEVAEVICARVVSDSRAA